MKVEGDREKVERKMEERERNIESTIRFKGQNQKRIKGIILKK